MLCKSRQCSLLEVRRGTGAVACEMPILDFRTVVRIHVGAMEAPADYFGGIDFGAATTATWLRRVTPVSRKLELDYTFG